MFFGILLTPKQFLIAVLMGAAIGLMFMAPWLFGTTPSRLDDFPEKIAALTETYETANAEIVQKTKLAETAVLNTKVSPLVISNDVRLTATVKSTVENIIDQPAIGVNVLMKIHSSSMDNCVAKLDLTRGFKNPLLPGETENLELQWQTLAMLAIQDTKPNQSSNCGIAKPNELIGTHRISKVEAIVNYYLVNDPQRGTREFVHQIGPTAEDHRARLNAKEKLDHCAPVIALVNENKFAEEDIENHAICFNSIGLTPRQPTLKEMREYEKKLSE